MFVPVFQVKVDSKNKTELLKYLTRKNKLKTQDEVTDEEVGGVLYSPAPLTSGCGL